MLKSASPTNAIVTITKRWRIFILAMNWGGPDRHPKGGETIVQISLPDGRYLEGVAKCSLSDSYNRKVGVNIALGRALKNL